MHKFVLACGIACLFFSAGTAQAQDYDADAKSATTKRHYGKNSSVRDSTVSPQFLLFQRAAKRTEERQMRIEARKWYGLSPQRPYWGPARYGLGFDSGRNWTVVPDYWPARY